VFFIINHNSDKEVSMDTNVQSLSNFRTKIHGSFPYRPDATMDIIDALSSNALVPAISAKADGQTGNVISA
jgi:hypothetical protein